MARHFLTLYLLIVATLAAATWGQERLWEIYGRRSAAEDAVPAAALALFEEQLRAVPVADRRPFTTALAANSGVNLELFEPADIAGRDTLERLARGEAAFMRAADGETWILKRLRDEPRVIAFRYSISEERSGIEWALAFGLYAAIGLAIMAWLWPLTRDLRRLERSTTTFGDRNWVFDADIKPGSQVRPLAEAFRRMAERIDSLIGSHQDMSNAVSHEIKTPLARMRFEIEMARTARDGEIVAKHLNNIDTDIAELNAFVTAALDYAILERAEVALNVGEHDFTLILPAVTDSVRRAAPPSLALLCELTIGKGDTSDKGDGSNNPSVTRVHCDAHLMETVLRNLLYNAIRYARTRIRVAFAIEAAGTGASYVLHVDDDGPGIPEADRERVFGSFVQLAQPRGTKTGYGLGLAIVRRAVEWHAGTAAVLTSPLGGARFEIRWPAQRAR